MVSSSEPAMRLKASAQAPNSSSEEVSRRTVRSPPAISRAASLACRTGRRTCRAAQLPGPGAEQNEYEPAGEQSLAQPFEPVLDVVCRMEEVEIGTRRRPATGGDEERRAVHLDPLVTDVALGDYRREIARDQIGSAQERRSGEEWVTVAEVDIYVDIAAQGEGVGQWAGLIFRRGWVTVQPLGGEHGQVEIRSFHSILHELSPQRATDEEVGADAENDDGSGDQNDEGSYQPGPDAALASSRPGSISDASNGPDQGRLSWIGFDLRPESLDGHVHQPGITQISVAPHTLEQHFAGEHLGRSPGQLNQQPELGWSQSQVGAVPQHQVSGDVDLQRTRVESFGWLELPGTAQGGPQASHELGHLKRFGYVVVGSGFEPNDDVDRVGPGRQHHDRNRRFSSDGPTHLEAVELREHDVEYDGFGPIGAEPVQARFVRWRR